jgi:predicted site-specific integrase-resolvase
MNSTLNGSTVLVQCPDELMTRAQACEYLGISIRTFSNYSARGLFPVTRFSKRCIRVKRSAIEKAADRLASTTD